MYVFAHFSEVSLNFTSLYKFNIRIRKGFSVDIRATVQVPAALGCRHPCSLTALGTDVPERKRRCLPFPSVFTFPVPLSRGKYWNDLHRNTSATWKMNTDAEI